MPKNWQEAHDWLAQGGSGAALVVSCPRCDRRGVVAPSGEGQYTIEWHDETNGWTWRDSAVTVEELESPSFGCGYDRLANKGFVGGAPFARQPR
jgi:hypothetical protein